MDIFPKRAICGTQIQQIQTLRGRIHNTLVYIAVTRAHLLGIKLCCKLALWLQDVNRRRRIRWENCSVVLLQEKSS